MKDAKRSPINAASTHLARSRPSQLQHPVRAGDGLGSMGHDDLGQVELADRLVEHFFLVDVEVTGGFIEEQDLWLPVERTRQNDALPLPTR